MRCEKCLHYEVCVKLGKPSLYGINQKIGCSEYKDKTKWVEKKIGNCREMIVEKCKYEGTGIWDGRCTGTKELDPCPGYDKCKQYKPNYMTNADRIRKMTDEELEKFICSFLQCEFCDFEERGRYKLLEWLKQPAE